MEWKLAEAKNKFSELVSKALTEGPQRVRRRKDTVFVLSCDEYEALTGGRPNFKEFLKKKGPSLTGIELKRDKSTMRDVSL